MHGFLPGPVAPRVSHEGFEPGRFNMFLEVIHSEGLAHLSYIVGHGKQAAVIDPRRDCEVYVDIAHRNGACITHIFETHRNEDYVIGSNELARRTGAGIYPGSALDFEYGNAVHEGDRFDLDGLFLTILDVRQEEEFEQGHLKGALNIYLGHVLERLDDIPRDRPVVTFCGSGQRAIIAASFLKKHGYTDVANCLGSMSACRKTKCPIEASAESEGNEE